MSYFESKKKELEDLLSLIGKERKLFENFVELEKQSLDRQRENLEKERDEFGEQILETKRLHDGVIQMARERQIGFPWLAEAYDELFSLQEEELVSYLQNKKFPAEKAADVVREQSQLRRHAESQRRILEWQLRYYESIAPFLVELKQPVEDISDGDQDSSREYTAEELQDEAAKYLTKEEFRKLSLAQRDQLALDRFWQRRKSAWLIGRLYERYIGYLFEEKGYDVDYVGIFKGLEAWDVT